jgi:hypothetical protein
MAASNERAVVRGCLSLLISDQAGWKETFKGPSRRAERANDGLIPFDEKGLENLSLFK